MMVARVPILVSILVSSVVSWMQVSQADWPLVACRAGTLLLPGIGDHFPWDYEAALRDALLQGGDRRQQ